MSSSYSIVYWLSLYKTCLTKDDNFRKVRKELLKEWIVSRRNSFTFPYCLLKSCMISQELLIIAVLIGMFYVIQPSSGPSPSYYILLVAVFQCICLRVKEIFDIWFEEKKNKFLPQTQIFNPNIFDVVYF